MLEEHGVNAIIADPAQEADGASSHATGSAGGKIQWIAEGHPDADDWKTNIKQSIDFGAAAVYVQGVIGDQWLKEGRLDLLGECVEFIKSQGVPGGVGAHKLEVIIEAERRKLRRGFLRQDAPPHRILVHPPARPGRSTWWTTRPTTTGTWTRRRPSRFMRKSKKPWIAFKMLAAGAIRPESGFQYAFENGADFICVGMFDFQVEANVNLARGLLSSRDIQNRQRGWMA